jgi:lipid-binding SYLF domain-containing protein
MQRTFPEGVLGTLLVALLSFGCSSNSNSAAPATHQQKSVSAQRVNALLKGADALADLAGRPENAIPSAILNRTKCLVFVPLGSGSGGDTTPGVASCRETENSWTRPLLIEFSPMREYRASGDLLLLLDEAAHRKLLRADLKLDARASAGPVTRDVKLATNAELDQDIWIYVRQNGLIKGKKVSGALVLRNSPAEQRAIAFYQIVTAYRSGDLDGRFEASLISFFNAITPTGIIIHHSGVIPTTKQMPTSEAEVDHFHEERGFETICFGQIYHVAYHFLILPDGKIQAGRPERCQGAHAPGYNSYLGISLVGDFSSIDNPRGAKGIKRPTAMQMKSLLVLSRRLRWQYDIPLQRILRHSDVTATLCPGDRFPFTALLQRLEQQ